jgi:Glyoxalase-like domain
VSWIHAVIDVPADQYTVCADFWGRALGWRVGHPWADHPELRSFEPPTGAAYVHVQLIDEPPRVHLDLESEAAGVTVERALDLGAELVAERDAWCTLRSPGALPFCVLRGTHDRPPEPVSFPDGHRTRLVQVCIDSPRAAQATEVAFWRALLPGRWVPSSRTEFAGKWHDDAGSPLQLLFQELDEIDGPVRAHLDLGTDDLQVELGRLLDVGASDAGPGRGWHVLRDPVDRPFCITENSPDQTTLRDLG